MHQTFYIDIDEEITLIVERLRKAKANEIVIVVPKRALLIQSIVNLRLLKKEAENLGLQLMIVTQDKLGKLLVEKAGILVQQKLDDSLGEDLDMPEKLYENTPAMREMSEEERAEAAAPGAGNRLNSIGSTNFFDERKVNFEEKVPVEAKNKPEEKKEALINKELVTGIGMDMKSRASAPARPNMDIGSKPEMSPAYPFPNKLSPNMDLGRDNSGRSFRSDNQSRGAGTDPQDRKIEKFFSLAHPGEDNFHKGEEDNFNPAKEASHSSGKKVLVSVLAVVIVLALVGGALFFLVPKAVIAITVKEKTKSQDCDIDGSVNAVSIDYDNGIIPAKLVTVTAEVSRKFNTTGSKSLSNQKARGKITIYNEYNSSEQPLVATTRFMSEDGKIFRLIKGVTVPGMNGSTAGTIEAEVVADESGTEYNIGPAKFSIPGFKDSGNEKYTKFYAKSTSAMSGGGSGNDETKAISESDVTNAKNALSKEINGAVMQKIKDSAGTDMMVLEEAVSKDEPTYKLSSSIGEVVDNFEVTIDVKANALVFKEDDLKSVVNSILAKSGSGKMKMDGSSLALEYGKLEPDFRAGTLGIKVHGVGKISQDIDVTELKKNVLGKTNEELETMLDQYPDIQKAEITYWPPFVSGHIPKYPQRVEIILDTVSDGQ